jgi:hypothetical protein
MLFALQAAIALLVSSPQQASPPPPAAQPGAEASDDIIVSALRIPREKLPTGVYWDYQSIFQSRIGREQATMFMRCAIRNADAAALRRIVDGEINSPRQKAAQGWVVLRGSACQPGLPPRAGFNNQAQSIVDLGGSAIDRSIITELVLRTFATDHELTAADLADEAVRQRHNLREQARNRLRLPTDRAAWSVSSCLVREQPTLATRLVRAEAGSLLERGLSQALLVGGRRCLGNTTKLTIDPSYLRAYVVDAYYRWLVAARNVASLVPADAPRLSRADTQG